MKYSDLIFDLYGTLVDIHTEENDTVWEKTALLFSFYGAHYTSSELKEAFQIAMARSEAREGQSYECFPDIPFQDIMQQLFIEKGITKNADTLGIQAAQLFRICSIDYIKLYPHVLTALERLREAGCRLWLLSNAQKIFTAYELRHLGLWEQFDGVYLSSDFRCRKPDARFFRALLDDQKLNPARCLMIGNDRMTDIAGAKAVGLDTLYMHTNLTPPDQAEADESRCPGAHTSDIHHYEYEGFDWLDLTERILSL